MNALLLPGNSARHEAWVEDLRISIASHFDIVKTQHYQHWKTGGDAADVEFEIDIATKLTNDIHPYILIAKSIGTVIAVRGSSERKLHPDKMILLGIPINGGAPKDQFAEWLKTLSTPIIIIQNSHDPLGSFADVKSAFEDTGKHVSFIELPGETHDYLDFDAIAKFI